eukprot:TRINITY_DN8991_c0_g1::TRINITY_DN8991_c0_g1_i1::g.24666::m.24666 TRINITY_DN8991_c0_g1::TRINITY_DN8991_c0_g1_i1::g.24666  ORF type:complete len:355 (+),score=18.32,sp/Q54E34/Y6398_DICDI/40.00/5e-51,Pkinase/PF00069.20/2.2e-47,Pkinase_Tyr/PF07714.12/1.1e-27,Kinase-like/PF14531.1/1e+03,Kinase-like/PF14531.1/1.7e-05 TRINITY_DN8991_c0_g1_i1:93-1157(+)
MNSTPIPCKSWRRHSDTSPTSVQEFPSAISPFADDDFSSPPSTDVVRTLIPPPTPQRPLPIDRCASLEDTKLLMANRNFRSESEFLFSDNFIFCEIIGCGSRSQVYKAQHVIKGSFFAVKRAIHHFRGRRDREDYLREIESVSALPDHPHIVKYYRSWQEGGHFFIQMELCPFGSLYSYSKRVCRPFTLLEIWSYILQITSGLSFLHSYNLLHLDIKPHNIFLAEHGILKIGDFGSISKVGCVDVEEGDCIYLAPELLIDSYPATPAADIFSLGIMVYSWITHADPPVSGPHWQALRNNTIHFPPQCDVFGRTDVLKALVCAMLQHDPTSRPSAAVVYQTAADVLTQLQCAASS